MTINSETSKVRYSGNGSTTVFPYTFRVNANDDLAVIVADADDTQYDLTLDTHYTVSGAGEDSGGNVTTLDLTSLIGYEKVPTNWSITIRREVTLTQDTDLTSQDGFSEEIHEGVFDYLTMIAQQQQEHRHLP